MNVWSRGIEARGEIVVRVQQTTLKFGLMSNYVLSTNQVAKSVNDASVDKQLIYVPIYSGSGKLSLIHKSFTATIGTTYTGYRYTSTDNIEFLDPYWLTNASLAYNMPLRGKNLISLSVQGFNLFALLGVPFVVFGFDTCLGCSGWGSVADGGNQRQRECECEDCLHGVTPVVLWKFISAWICTAPAL